MIPILAQLDKLPAEFLRDWLIALGGIALTVIAVLNLLDRFRARKAAAVIVSPDPMRVAEVKELATRAEVDSVRAAIEADIASLREEATRERAKAHGEIVAIHNRINTVAENTTAISGGLAEIGKNVSLLLQRSMK